RASGAASGAPPASRARSSGAPARSRRRVGAGRRAGRFVATSAGNCESEAKTTKSMNSHGSRHMDNAGRGAPSRDVGSKLAACDSDARTRTRAQAFAPAPASRKKDRISTAFRPYPSVLDLELLARREGEAWARGRLEQLKLLGRPVP